MELRLDLSLGAGQEVIIVGRDPLLEDALYVSWAAGVAVDVGPCHLESVLS